MKYPFFSQSYKLILKPDGDIVIVNFKTGEIACSVTYHSGDDFNENMKIALNWWKENNRLGIFRG